MKRKIRATNPETIELIKKLKEKKESTWKNLAKILSKPKRNRATVNVGKINRYTKDGDVILVPGKVLGYGDINKKVVVVALSFSREAKRKIEQSGGKCKKIEEIIDEKPKGIKIMK